MTRVTPRTVVCRACSHTRSVAAKTTRLNASCEDTQLHPWSVFVTSIKE